MNFLGDANNVDISVKGWETQLIKNLLSQIKAKSMFLKHLQLAIKTRFKLLILSFTHDEESLKQTLRNMSREELIELGLTPLNSKRK